MQGLEPREAVLECAARDGDIAEGALWIAADDCPGVEPEPWLERLDELAGELRSRCGLNGCGPADAPMVGALLRDRLRLRGAGGGDPRAHYLHHVLDRGAGVPIACSAIWIAVGARAHIPIEGVNLPGHFVVRVEGHMFDTVASGEPLDDDDVLRLVTSSTGKTVDGLEPGHLARASSRDMLARMSRNLRRCYTSLECWDQALRAADRCVDLMASAPAERRDRGLLLWRMGKIVAALADINAYLDEAPDACPDRSSMTEVAGRLRAFLN
jgi:regulator of sirC expression with transglutaminase-like and TPR domain